MFKHKNNFFFFFFYSTTSFFRFGIEQHFQVSWLPVCELIKYIYSAKLFSILWIVN